MSFKMPKITKKQFKIEGMHCNSCALSIDMDVEDLEGVKTSDTSYAKQVLEVELDEEKVKVQQIIEAIEKLGYKALPVVN